LFTENAFKPEQRQKEKRKTEEKDQQNKNSPLFVKFFENFVVGFLI